MSNQSNLIGQRLGQYQITGLLGRGGMATVYRARQTSIDRDVAIKVIKPDLAEMEDFIKRFEREAKTVASLSNAHILKVFDYGRDQDIVYLVMELLTGGSLAELIGRGAIESEKASQILDQIASALDYAHRQGIIHRDLKPQNVLLDADQDAFLTDFGLAKLLNAGTRLTYGSGTMGTPAYMAPEQWQGGVVDARTDIYALGVLLFEMLSGTLPFNGDTPFRMMHMHVYEQPRMLLDLKMDFPPDVDKVLRRALAKDREERFASAGEMAKAFRLAVSGPDASKLKRPVSSDKPDSPPVDRITLLPIVDNLQPTYTGVQQPPPPEPLKTFALPPVPPSPVTPITATTPVPSKPEKRSLMLPLLIAGIAVIAIVAVLIAILSGKNSAAAPIGNSTVSATVGNIVVVAAVPSSTVTPTSTTALTNTVAPTSTIAFSSTIAPTNTIAASNTVAPTETNTPSNTNTATDTAVAPTVTAAPTNTNTVTLTPPDTLAPTQAVVTTGPSSTPTRPMVTAKDKLYSHTGPSNRYQQLGIMQKGDQLPVVGQAISGTAIWYEVLLPNQQTAWVFAQNVDLTPPDAPIPLVATPTS